MDFDFLDQPPRIRPRRPTPPNDAGPLFIVLVLIAAAGVTAVYLGRQPRPAAEQPAEWTAGPKTYAEAVRLWKDESEILAGLRVSRLLADERRDRAGDGFIPIDSRGDGTRARLARLDAEVAKWDRQIAAQAAKVERARQRKEQLDH